MIFLKKLKCFLSLVFVKINLEKIFANAQNRHKSFLGYKNIDF